MDSGGRSAVSEAADGRAGYKRQPRMTQHLEASRVEVKAARWIIQ